MSSTLEAALSLELPVLKELLESGFGINSQIPGTDGHTLLHIAAGVNSIHQENIINYLLKEGADPNIYCQVGFTPVHISVMWGHDRILKILLNNKGNPWAVDKEGKNSFDLSKEWEERECVTVLEEYMKSLSEDISCREQVIKQPNSKSEFPKGFFSNDYTDEISFSSNNKQMLLKEKSCPKNNPLNSANHSELNVNKCECSLSKGKKVVKDYSLKVDSTESVKNDMKKSQTILCNSSWFGQSLSDDGDVSTLSSSLGSSPASSVFTLDTAFLEDSHCTFEFEDDKLSVSALDVTSFPAEPKAELSNSEKILFIPNDSNSIEKITGLSKGSADSIEEYIHTDVEAGVTLVERRYPSSCSSTETLTCATDNSTLSSKGFHTAIENFSSGTSTTEISSFTIPSDLYRLSNSEIRRELIALGDNPGPVMDSIREIYLKKLAKLKTSIANVPISSLSSYSPEIVQVIENKLNIIKAAALEEDMCEEFQQPDSSKKWREGTQKVAFTYLLLNPSVTCNLPAHAPSMSLSAIFSTFIEAIFYIGKGTRTRPFAHFYEAVKSRDDPLSKVNCKVQNIIDIWSAGMGVISLHCFQNIIPVEAYTREACMVEALGLDNLTNERRGNYYGVSASWTAVKKRLLGAYLLYRAMNIFLNEGERQIRPKDIKS